MKLIPIIATTLCTALSASTYANTALNNYQDIVNAISSGSKLNIVLDTSQCSGAQYAVLGGFTPKAVAVANGEIVVSNTTFNTMEPFAPGVPVYEYALYQIHNDGSVTVDVSGYNATNYALAGKFPTVTCQLGKGLKVFFSS